MPHSRPTVSNRRVLVIDDTQSIHDDFDKILRLRDPSEPEESLDELDKLIFEQSTPRETPSTEAIDFRVSHAMQGLQAIELVRSSIAEAKPFAVAFVDMRMPPGIDGQQTIEEIWKIDPQLQIVICSAYSDHTWDEILARLGHSDRLLVLKKPFDQAEVYQMAAALSEKWNAERRTQRLTRELEQKVEERTASLNQLNTKLTHVNAELETALEEANCAVRAKGRFLATMSHEIRTTLNGIMGASYMLTKAELQEDDRDFANIIQTSGEGLMTIINDILDYSKFDSGQLELDEVSFSLSELANECAALLKPIYDKEKVPFTLTIDSALPDKMIGDPTRLRQILLNLLNNAIKFSAGTNVDFEIRYASGEETAATIEFLVRDGGIGMNEDAVNRLFSAFMQADSSTTRKFGGTGLGLAICKLLADAMEAEILVDSKIGEGSTFTVRLTLPIDQSSEEDDLIDQESPSELPAIDGLAEKHILVVDDNAINRKLAGRFLKKLGLTADIATNGEEAVEMFLSRRYDLILMDHQMPVLSGTAATRKIRELESKKEPSPSQIPIIALTANALAEAREACLSSGMSDFLTKPIQMRDLRSTLSKWLSVSDN